MFKSLSKLPEWRILGVLGVIALSWHLLTIFGSFIGIFSDIFFLIVLAWILAFIIEPLVTILTKRGLSRTGSAIVIYLAISLFLIALTVIVLPTTITQLSQLFGTVPSYFPANSIWSSHIQDFINTSLANSVVYASQAASVVTSLALVLILSFYFLISKKEISQFILKIIPDDYENDYLFLENTINTTFASFLRIQVLLGLLLGAITFAALLILQVNYALSTAVASAFLAMIPVVGAVLFIIPPVLAALTISLDKALIVAIVIFLAAQIVYNIVAPKLLGEALKIHPIIVFLSFIIGFKVAGIAGAIFAVPVVAAFTIIAADLLKYWQEEADK